MVGYRGVDDLRVETVPVPRIHPGELLVKVAVCGICPTMLELVNTVLKAVKRLALLKGDCVLVAGQGPIGLLFTQLLTATRMKVIAIDLLDQRLNRARDFGARLVASANDTTVNDRMYNAQARTRRGNNYRALRCSRPTGIGIGAGGRPSPDFRPHSPRQ